MLIRMVWGVFLGRDLRTLQNGRIMPEKVPQSARSSAGEGSICYLGIVQMKGASKIMGLPLPVVTFWDTLLSNDTSLDQHLILTLGRQ